jgi:small-conductance mechanosensitive channel
VQDVIRLVGPNRAVELFGVRLVGVNAETGTKLLLMLGLVVVLAVLRRALHFLVSFALRRHGERARFWARQGVQLLVALLFLIGMASVWFDDPARLATAAGLFTAGLAFALQRVITAIAGYFVILRGKTFNVGDRITMGGVRGDVIALSLVQTTIMEMGQPPPVQEAEPAVWVRSRQYTGRVVTVSNARIFDEPVYNYTRDFPFIWEELALHLPYTADRARAERILLDAAHRHTVRLAELGDEAIAEMRRRYVVDRAEMEPRVYWRLDDRWLELTVRFIAREHGVRDLKDALSRDILAALDDAGIGFATGTIEVVGVPPLRLERAQRGA